MTTLPLPPPPLLLVRHLPVVREHLIPFLTTPDLIALLWTSPALRDDDEIQRRAFAHHTDVGHFFCGGQYDWCADVPTFGSDCYDEYYEDEEEDGGRDHNTVVVQSPHEIMQRWQTQLRSPTRCAALLSLAWLMATELKELLRSNTTPNVTSFTVVPFILPLARLNDLATTQPPPGPASALGCHIENCTVDERNGETVRCGLCAAVAAVHTDAEAYRTQRTAEEAALQQHLRDQGYDSDGCDFDDRMYEFHERMEATDERYDEGYLEENMGTLVVSKCREGTLSPLQLLTAANAAMDLVDGFCETMLRPLVAFFRRHGFGRVHFTRLRNFRGQNEYDTEEIRRVEMVGAAAPHGFFAGVYFVERYT